MRDLAASGQLDELGGRKRLDQRRFSDPITMLMTRRVPHRGLAYKRHGPNQALALSFGQRIGQTWGRPIGHGPIPGPIEDCGRASRRKSPLTPVPDGGSATADQHFTSDNRGGTRKRVSTKRSFSV